MSFAAGATQAPRGRFPSRTGIGGRWCEPGRQGFRRTPVFRATKNVYSKFFITGVTKDSAGVVLGACDVHLIDAQTDMEVKQDVSDASGNFSFQLGNNSVPHYIVAYLVGSPDVAGTTRNDIYATVA